MNEEEKYRQAEQTAKNELCNTMCLCPKIRAADACDRCAVFASLREYYMSVIDVISEDSLENYTWAEIAEISAAGKAAEKFCIGDEKTETLYTGEKVTFVIVGFNHDRLEKGGRAGITFGLKNLLDGNYEMNAEYTNEGGWRVSKMRNVYMQRIFQLLPSELRDYIKPVIKTTGTGGRASEDLEQTVDKLFLFSGNEVYGIGEYKEFAGDEYFDGPEELAVAGEGAQYPYFIDPENRVRYSRGDQVYWWLRSPHFGDDIFFCYVDRGGEMECKSAQAREGIRFGFCI